jgi:hypothetical protein
MNQFEKIFLGNTPADQREFLLSLLGALKPRPTTLVMPAVGQFSMAKVAMQAGFKPEQIHTSDISVFTSIIGYLYAGRPLATLPLRLGKFEGRPGEEIDVALEFGRIEGDVQKAAFLLWAIKVKQIKPKNFYVTQIRDGLLHERQKIIAKLEAQLAENVKRYAGIRYEAEDMRQVIGQERGEDTLLLVNPPAYPKGYTKLFDTEGAIELGLEFAEFNLKAEFAEIYRKIEAGCPAVVLIHENAYKALDKAKIEFRSKIVYATQRNENRLQFYVLTRPTMLPDFDAFKRLATKTVKVPRPYTGNPPIWSESDRLAPDTKVTVRPIPSEVALYYRDLWVHKLGSVKSERYYLILLDGRAFAVVGFHVGNAQRLKADIVYETFAACSQIESYPRPSRLMMLILTTGDMARTLLNGNRKNRLFDFKELQTTCLSKYRKVKHHRPPFKLLRRTKLPNGTYHLVYSCDFRQDTFGDAVRQYLAEINSDTEENDAQ